MRKKQLGVRFAPELVEKIDAWLADMNRTRRVPLTRSELVVGVLDWAEETRPDWEHRVPASAAPPPVPLQTVEPDSAEPAPERYVEREDVPTARKRGRSGR